MNKNKLQKKEKNNPTVLNLDANLNTLTFTVTLQPSKRKDIFFLLKDGVLTVEFPETSDYNSENIQKKFWNGIDYFLRKEAKRLLPERTSDRI